MKKYRYSVEYVPLDLLCRYLWKVEYTHVKGPYDLPYASYSKYWNQCDSSYATFKGGAERAARRNIRRQIREDEKTEKRTSRTVVVENVEYP